MISIKKFIFLQLLLLVSMNITAQKFFNLTSQEVKIDSLLPQFTYSYPLGEDYTDSVYTVSIAYPDFIDMSQSDIARYNSISGKLLPELPSISKQIVVSRKRGTLEVSFCPLVYRNNRYQILVSFMLNIKSQPLNKAKTHAQNSKIAPADRYTYQSVLANGRWAKIRIPSTGIYNLTENVIRKAGFTDLSKVKIYGYGGALQNEKLVAEDLIKYDDLKELPTCTVNGKRLFWAQGPVSWQTRTQAIRTRNPYSNYGYYFITQGSEEPLSVDSSEFVKSVAESADNYHALHEIDNFAWFHGGRNLFEATPIESGTSKDFKLSAPGNSPFGRVTVSVSAGTSGQIEVALNDSVLGSLPITLYEYDQANAAVATYEVGNLKKDNKITITPQDVSARLDYISLAFNEPFAVSSLATTSFPVPEYVYNITNQNHHADGPADMIIIIPTSQKMRYQAQRIKEFHEQRDSLRVRIVPADELYNEYSSGTPDANAYRRYLKMLYDRAGNNDADMPKYLLLFGDCVWDNRMLTADCINFKENDYLLCYESENSFNKVNCYVDDGFFCLLDDGEGTNPQSSDKLDMAVGRFPVTTEAEARIMVDKTIAYANNRNAGAWQNTLVFMGDDGNNNQHMDDANSAAEETLRRHPGYLVKKIMWDSYNRESSFRGNSYPDATAAIKQMQTNGALIMDYAGHGREDQVSHEAVLKLIDFESFRNQNLPLWITASCDIMPFDGVTPNIGEAAVLNDKGGAVAFWGTTRTVYANYNRQINMAFLRHLLASDNGKTTTLGMAQMLAKNEMIATGHDITTNKLQYSLLGDPALALRQPTLTAVVDSINGEKAGETNAPLTLKSGTVVKVKGHIEGAPDFNGLLTATVRDTRELITCKLNDNKDAEEPFQYYDRTKVLFNGADSVRQGIFEFSFAVPKDINYAEGSGLMNLYAVNTDATQMAHGACDAFTIVAGNETGNNSVGPSVYCYLNSPSFVNGGNVNPTPYFVAQLKDEDGINATGNGLGHDLRLVIDGNMWQTYVLNDNFKYDFGTYTGGSTYYSIPELSPGKHKLEFKAWDVLNNSSTTELTFNVVRGLSPDIVSVDVSHNPARTSTTFIVTHDRSDSNMNVEINVYDWTGRRLWNHVEKGVVTRGTYTLDWDLTLENGSRMQHGVYLYTVGIDSDGSKKTSKVKKLIVLGNN